MPLWKGSPAGPFSDGSNFQLPGDNWEGIDICVVVVFVGKSSDYWGMLAECNDVAEADKWRSQILREIGRKVMEIQNAGLGEHILRDLNDEINKLVRLGTTEATYSYSSITSSSISSEKKGLNIMFHFDKSFLCPLGEREGALGE